MCECYRWRRDYIDSCGSVRDVCVNVTGGGGDYIDSCGSVRDVCVNVTGGGGVILTAVGL